MLITRCPFRAYLLRKAIIFDARPPEPPESATRARAHLPPPLAIYLHLAGERIDSLRASGAGPGRVRGLFAAAPRGRASNVSAARPAGAQPPPLTLSNSATSRPLAPMQSGREKANRENKLVPGLAQRWEVGGRSFQMGARERQREREVPGRECPRGRCPFVF